MKNSIGNSERGCFVQMMKSHLSGHPLFGSVCYEKMIAEAECYEK